MHGKSERKEVELGINERVFLGLFFRDGLLVRGAGCSLTGFRWVCIKNVFRNIKYLGFLNYLFDTQMPLAIPWRMVALHLTNCASKQASVCPLPLIAPGWISKIHWATGFTQMSGEGGGKRLEEKGLAWETGTQYSNEPPWQIHFIMLRESN